MGIIEFLCDIRFHHSFIIPDTNLRVSYADYGDTSSDAVILFCGPLMGSRFCYALLDQLAKANKVRIVHPDRAGVGGSDRVELGDRIKHWVEMVPHLLTFLNISHVSIVSHSGGVIYALNTILTYPHFLHPRTPYIAFFAPWVHYTHSGVMHLKAAGYLPAPLVGKFASVAKFVGSNIIPLSGQSSTFVHSIKDWIAPSAATANSSTSTLPTRPDITSTGTDSNPADLDFCNEEAVNELRLLTMRYLFAEDISGISADAQLFLKNPPSTSWSHPNHLWSDLKDYVPLISSRIAQENSNGVERKWTMNSFHAETDEMVGNKGRLWFDACWASSNVTYQLDYDNCTVSGANHDNLISPQFGAATKWMQRVREAFPQE